MRFILFDRIVELKKGQEARFLKNVSQSEDFFMDHFPGYPVVPGSVLLGTFEQGAEIFLAVTHDFTLRPVLQRIAKASFRHFVVPGDQLEIYLSLGSESPVQIQAQATVHGKRVADARLEFALMHVEDDPTVTDACRRLQDLYAVFTSNPLAKAWELWARNL